MAKSPTIYKFAISLSDLDRNRYEPLNLVVARHPSETPERMLVRVLAYCINAGEGLAFGKGLSDPEEPDLWLRSLDSQISMWIYVGEPKIERIKKSAGLGGRVRVYSFNTKSSIWWQSVAEKCNALSVEVFQFVWSEIQTAAGLIERTMQLSITISDNAAYMATDNGECEISWVTAGQD